VSVAGISGGASYGRGGDADGWRPASVGLPVATGDRLYAARGGSLELDSAGFAIHLASATGLEALELTDDVKRFYVWGGSASFLVRQLTPGESFGVDSPNATVRFERAGEYRIDVGREGDTCVVVDRGNSWVSAAGVSVPLGPGDLARIDGIRAPASGGPPAAFRHARACGPPARTDRARDQVLPFCTRGRS
jgi:hypothetical protein